VLNQPEIFAKLIRWNCGKLYNLLALVPLPTNTYAMKTTSLKRPYILAFIICSAIYANAQQKIPRNYAGLSGIGELNRLAISCGLEYERWLFIKNQFAIGAKAHYIFPSKTIDYIFSSNESLQRNSQTHIMATSYFFTNQEKETKGFFLSFGAGVNFIRWQQEASDASGDHYIATNSEVLPGFDFSVGGQLAIGNRNAIRIMGGYETFLAHKYKELINGKGTALLYIKVSVGF